MNPVLIWSDEKIDPLAPARGVLTGIAAAVLLFWLPLLVWILAK